MNVLYLLFYNYKNTNKNTLCNWYLSAPIKECMGTRYWYSRLCPVIYLCCSFLTTYFMILFSSIILVVSPVIYCKKIMHFSAENEREVSGPGINLCIDLVTNLFPVTVSPIRSHSFAAQLFNQLFYELSWGYLYVHPESKIVSKIYALKCCFTNQWVLFYVSFLLLSVTLTNRNKLINLIFVLQWVKITKFNSVALTSTVRFSNPLKVLTIATHLWTWLCHIQLPQDLSIFNTHFHAGETVFTVESCLSSVYGLSLS